MPNTMALLALDHVLKLQQNKPTNCGQYQSREYQEQYLNFPKLLLSYPLGAQQVESGIGVSE